MAAVELHDATPNSDTERTGSPHSQQRRREMLPAHALALFLFARCRMRGHLVFLSRTLVRPLVKHPDFQTTSACNVPTHILITLIPHCSMANLSLLWFKTFAFCGAHRHKIQPPYVFSYTFGCLLWDTINVFWEKRNLAKFRKEGGPLVCSVHRWCGAAAPSVQGAKMV